MSSLFNLSLTDSWCTMVASKKKNWGNEGLMYNLTSMVWSLTETLNERNFVLQTSPMVASDRKVDLKV